MSIIKYQKNPDLNPCQIEGVVSFKDQVDAIGEALELSRGYYRVSKNRGTITQEEIDCKLNALKAAWANLKSRRRLESLGSQIMEVNDEV